MDDRRTTSGIGKSHLDAFPRGDEVDVFLTPLSAFSSGCNSWLALSRNIKIKRKTIFSCLEDFFDLFSLAPSSYLIPD